MLIIGTYAWLIISRNDDPCSTRDESYLDFLFVLCTVSEENIVSCKIQNKNEVSAEY